MSGPPTPTTTKNNGINVIINVDAECSGAFTFTLDKLQAADIPAAEDRNTDHNAEE